MPNAISKLCQKAKKALGLEPDILENTSGRHIEKYYQLDQVLGSGSYGTTYLCWNKHRIGFACKSMLKKKVNATASQIAWLKSNINNEVRVMRSLPYHQHIVPLIDTYEDKKSVHLVMHLCAGGDLSGLLHSKGRLDEKEAAMLFKQIISMIQFLHANHVMHRDIKPDNLMFSNRRDKILKLIDFGFAARFRDGDQFHGILGSPQYMAPEILSRSHGPEVDVWSAGVVLYEMLCGECPFDGDSREVVYHKIINDDLDLSTGPWRRISTSVKDLLIGILEKDPNRRMSASYILTHPWMKKA